MVIRMSDESSNVQMRCHVPGDGTLEVHLAGSYTMASDRLPRCPDADKGPWRKIVFRDEGLVQWDTSLLALVRRAERDAPGTEVDLSDLPSGLRALAELTHRGDGDADGDASRPSTPFLVGAGVGLAKRAREGAAFLDFLGRVMISMSRCACGRAKTRPGAWRDHLWATGPAALGIVTVISLLVGAILAFVGAVQLGMFGAELFVANLVGLGMVMEMGALMTGIILTGRTGAAFAAQLGTMVVNEEVDALRTMGIPPSDYLVLPRVAAVALTTPLLVLYANALGLLGGALVGAARWIFRRGSFSSRRFR